MGLLSIVYNCALPSDNYQPAGIFNGKILLTDNTTPLYNPSFSDEEWLALNKAARIRFLALNLATGDLETLEKDFSAWSESGHYVTDGFYYFHRYAEEDVYHHESNLYEWNLNTQKETAVAEDLKNHVILFEFLLDGKVIYKKNEVILSPNGTVDVKYHGFYWCDTATGETEEMGLYREVAWETEDSDVSYKELVRPLADAGEYYLVVSNTTMSEEGLFEQKSLILKEDYWARKANYIPITML